MADESLRRRPEDARERAGYLQDLQVVVDDDEVRRAEPADGCDRQATGRAVDLCRADQPHVDRSLPLQYREIF